MASTRKLNPKDPKSPWVVEYTGADGKRHRRTPDSGLRRDAEALRQKIEQELCSGTHVAITKSVTVREAADLFMQECERRRKIGDRMTRTTMVAYESFVRNHIVARFGAVRLTDLNAIVLQDWLNDLAVTMKYGSLHRAYNVFKLILRNAVNRRLVGMNVLSDGRVRLPHQVQERVSVPSITEIERLLKVAETRGNREEGRNVMTRCLIVNLGLFCGMRRGEMAGLNWEDVDFAAGVIHLRRSMSKHDGLKSPKTAAGSRNIPMAERVLDLLLEAHKGAGRPAEGPVIVNRFGRRYFPEHLWQLWTRTAKRAGLADEQGKMRYRLHALRHAAASLLIREGLGPMHVKTFIGHAKVSTTIDIYGHLFPEDNSIATSVASVSGRFATRRKRDLLPQPI